MSTLEALTTTIAPVFPFVGADERFSLMLAGEPPSERTGGIWVSLDAVRWKTEQGTVGIDDVRRQSVLLVPRAAWPIDRERLLAYLAAVERVIATAPPERNEWAVPADWFDGDLLLPDLRSPERGPELVAALQPEAIALRKMVKWLSSGFEFGAPPTSIALWERRVMNWPPTKDRRELFLFRYEYPATRAGDEPRRGVGLVGSTTFSMFGAGAPRVDGTPEDALAAHCLCELGRTGAELSIGRALLGFAE